MAQKREHVINGMANALLDCQALLKRFMGLPCGAIKAGNMA